MAYNKQNFKNGNVLTAEELNKIDVQLYNLVKSFNEMSAVNNFKITEVTAKKQKLSNYVDPGIYYFTTALETEEIPSGTNGWLVVLKVPSIGNVKQIWFRSGSDSTHYFTFLRTRIGSEWTNWKNINSPTHYNDPKYVYVSNSGKDTNNGTESEPFKTLERAFELYNEGYIDLRIKIKEKGTYSFNKTIFNSVTLHIENITASPVTIKCSNTDYNVCFYNSHINSKGVNWEAGVERTLYFEGCTSVFSPLETSSGSESAISILPTIKTFGGFISIPKVKTGGIDLEYCTARLPEVDLTVTTNSYNLIHKATYSDIIFSLASNIYFKSLKIDSSKIESRDDFRYYNISGSIVEIEEENEFPTPNNGPKNSLIKRNIIYCNTNQKNTLTSKTTQERNQWITS
jgi:hypothetical protein